MLSTALIAMFALAASQDAPAPLSPASLTPPPKPAAQINRPGVFFFLHSDWVRATVEDCRHQALAAVAAQEGFRYAEITAEGQVAGYTDTCRILVLMEPGTRGTFAFVTVADAIAKIVYE